MAQATLRTERLLLEPLADRHLEDEVELDSDPEVMRYLTGRASDRGTVTEQHRRRIEAGRRAPGLGYWAGSVGGEFVGWWLLRPEDAEPTGVDGAAELGYRLLRRHWRRGLASEGARELLRHGFDDLGLRRVFAHTMAVNAGSRAVLGSVGLRHVRTVHEEWPDALPGSEQGEVEYAVTRESWSAPR